MTSISQILVFAVAVTLAVALPTWNKPNPCGFTTEGKPAKSCEDGQTCGAFTNAHYRKAICVKQPTSDRVCPLNFDPVCCKILHNRSTTITQTKGNSCQCSIVRGQSLFKGKCSRPPLKSVACTKELNWTCCYIARFDLTFTAGNPCMCTEQAGGSEVPDNLCGIPN